MKTRRKNLRLQGDGEWTFRSSSQLPPYSRYLKNFEWILDQPELDDKLIIKKNLAVHHKLIGRLKCKIQSSVFVLFFE